jgi:hypothetical protein
MTEKIIDPPKPASNFIPNWYKKLNIYANDHIKSHRFRGGGNLTAKACMPVLDSVSTGYMITLPCDINFVDPAVHGHRVDWETTWEVITTHVEKQVDNIGLPDIYEKDPFKFEGMWRVRVPRGYSLLYTHPFYHHDLTFLTATCIVDSDAYDTAINLPFWIRKDFFGILEQGTPIAQIIPIKRESWKSEILKYDPNYEFAFNNVKLKAFRSYKKRFWHRKTYT